MQRHNSVEHLIGANSSTKQKAMQKCCNASSSLLGLLTKRSIRVEPHPQVLDDEDAKRMPADEAILQANDVTFAKRCLEKPGLASVKDDNSKSQTPLPARRSHPSDITNMNRILEKSHSSGVITSMDTTPAVEKGDSSMQRGSRDGTQSDGDGKSDDISIKLRKHVKHRSPNHNRFSHQFSLCCKVEKKSLTPPFTVRYNSMQSNTQVLKKSAMTLNLNPTENIPMASPRSVSSSNYSSQALPKHNVSECASAPQSPVSAKSGAFAATSFAHGSTSNFSLKHRNNGGGCNDAPIRPLAVSDCRSRLREKLYPHGKEAGGKHENNDTHHHNSTPNIAGPVEMPKATSVEMEEHPMRFSSYENIQLHRQASSSGLARQALMAAQVLNLIPTEKTKDRNFPDSRLGSFSLLGPSELERLIPNKEVTIFVGTWNMNGQSPPKRMNDFVLPTPVEQLPDIVAIGTQESSSDRFEWEVSIQETLGPSHVLFHSTNLGTLHLAVYMRRDLIWYCSMPEDASMSVRTGTAFRTKGAVAISFCLFGTSMLFVTSHLTAHHQKVKERVSDVKRIIHALDLPKNLNLRYKHKDVTQNFDDVFWSGDLNFRLAEPREKLLEWIHKTKFPLPSHLPHGYMHTDQLSSVLAEGAAFRGFTEANITFPPTYKYDPGTQNFDTSSKQRAPAYTDRILYKYRQMQGMMSTITGISTPPHSPPSVECLMYDSVPSITTSDHKPVWALFKAIIRAGTDSIPLAAGFFSRDIYLEGIKRRMKNQYSGSSIVCSIQ